MRHSERPASGIAPQAHRAEIVSAYFVAAFVGNALPVIGVGVITTLVSATATSIAFAAMIVVFALVALFFGLRYGK